MALVNVCQIAKCACNLYKNHGLFGRCAVEQHDFLYCDGKKWDHLVINALQLDVPIRLRKTLNRTNRVVEQVKQYFVVFHELSRDQLAQQVFNLRLVFNEALGDDLTERRNETLLNKHGIKLAFFGVNKQSTNCLEQKVEYFLEVDRVKVFFAKHAVKYFEENMHVAERHP